MKLVKNIMFIQSRNGAMFKLMGKKKFGVIVGSLVEKPIGKLNLVPETDKREEVKPIASEFQVET